MKQLILQKEFVSDLFCLSDSGCKITDDLASFLIKDYSGYHLVCDFLSAEEYEVAAAENPILEAILDKLNSISYNPDLEKDVMDDEFYKNLKTDKNIFLTKFEEQTCKELSYSRGYIFVSSDKIASTWEMVAKLRKSKTFKVTNDKEIEPNQRFDNWSKIQSLSHPIKSAIIFDKYLLKNIAPMEVSLNLIPLIDNLLINNYKDRKLRITLISEIKAPFKLKQYIDKIEKLLQDIGWGNIEVNIIRHNKAFYPRALSEGLHARLILTNYMQIISDASFNFFKKRGAVENVANITASLNLYAFNEKSYSKDIEDIKLYVSKLKNENSSDVNYSDKFFPNKTNPLLN